MLCGECYSDWSLLIDELMARIESEDQRFRGLVRVHYGILSVKQRIGNVTSLRQSYDVITNFTINPSSLNETRIDLVNTFTEV